jgi:hypothetical protein
VIEKEVPRTQEAETGGMQEGNKGRENQRTARTQGTSELALA